jgi:amylosucrase
MAYNATLMALLWNSIATAKTTLLYRTLENLPEKPKDVTWITYLRCHDDIGLGFEDQYIYDIGWDAREHRKFLLDYYCQKLDWSPAMGYVFMYNEKTGDARITGSAASLLGLEKALKNDDRGLLDQATDKIILSHGIILSFGGIPMIYAGDEIGTLNDYSYLNDPHKQEDSRWVNRPFQNWRVIKTLHKKESHQSRIFNALRRLIAIRKKTEAFADRGNFILHDVSNPHLLMYERTHDSIAGVLVLCNFDTKPQVINSGRLDQLGYLKNSQLKDLISGKQIRLSSGLLELLPYQILWLVRT